MNVIPFKFRVGDRVSFYDPHDGLDYGIVVKRKHCAYEDDRDHWNEYNVRLSPRERVAIGRLKDVWTVDCSPDVRCIDEDSLQLTVAAALARKGRPSEPEDWSDCDIHRVPNEMLRFRAYESIGMAVCNTNAAPGASFTVNVNPTA